MGNKSRKKKKNIRVYMHGCFDLMHYGHCNAFRQARSLGTELIVGVVSDAEIIAIKGRPPVISFHERMIMVNAVKWVDDVIPDAPYAITEEFMKKLSTKYNIDYLIHGDAPCLLPDGTDAYALVREAGRYKQIKQTEGVSSTDIVGRMLLRIRARSVGETPNLSTLQQQFSHDHSQKFEDGRSGTGTRVSYFRPTSQSIVHFSNGKAPRPDARIVYIDGAFDFFHAGHAEEILQSDLPVDGIFSKLNDILKLARGLGDFLFVGIHTDLTISDHRGAHRPIMNLHDRSLSVLACRYVDGVILGAPRGISSIKMITDLDISLVLHGTVSESKDAKKVISNPYAIPTNMGIYRLLESPLEITTSTLISKIVSNHETNQVLLGLKKSLEEDVDQLKSEFQPLKIVHQQQQEDYTARLQNLVGLKSWVKKLDTQVKSLGTYQDELLEFLKSLSMEVDKMKLEYKDLWPTHPQPRGKDLIEKLRNLGLKDESQDAKESEQAEKKADEEVQAPMIEENSQAEMKVNEVEAPISEDVNMPPMKLLLLLREAQDLEAINHLIHDVAASIGQDISVAPFRCRWNSILHMALVCDCCCETHEKMPREYFDAIVTDDFNFELFSLLVEKLAPSQRFKNIEAHSFSATELRSLEPAGRADNASTSRAAEGLSHRVTDMIERRNAAAALRKRIVYILDPSRRRNRHSLLPEHLPIEAIREQKVDLVASMRNIKRLFRWNKERWGWEKDKDRDLDISSD